MIEESLERLNSWNIKKKIIESKIARKVVKEREVVFLSIGENIGYEQNEKEKIF